MSRDLQVYLSGPITGCSYDECSGWREKITAKLSAVGIHCLDPMRYTERLRKEVKITIQAAISGTGIMSGDALFARDKLDVQRSDLVLVNLLNCPQISIGTMFELAWAYLLEKPVVLVMEKSNVHVHPFVTKAASVWVDTLEEAVEITREILL